MKTTRWKLPPIRIGPCVIGAVAFRPDPGTVLRLGIAGHVIEVTSEKDYANIYHGFDRLKRTEAAFAHLSVVRRQVGPSRWLLFVRLGSKAVPEPQRDSNYDPKRGRYQRYAARIANGETLRFTTRAEAVKVRRAWQMYVPRRQRARLRCVICFSGRQKYALSVVAVTGHLSGRCSAGEQTKRIA